MKNPMEYTLLEIDALIKTAVLDEAQRYQLDYYLEMLLGFMQEYQDSMKHYQIKKEQAVIQAPKEISVRKAHRIRTEFRRQEEAALESAFCTLVAD